MQITKVTSNKKQYLPLLLLADEEEAMIDRYLERGTMYVLEDGDVKAECLVTSAAPCMCLKMVTLRLNAL